jgi:ferrous iron transport protein B
VRAVKYVLVGPPNTGKSTLFYVLTGIYARTANYPGTTVEVRRGRFRAGNVIVEVADTPGVLNPDSPRDLDEKVALEEALKGDYDGAVVVAAPHALREAVRLAEIVSRSKPVIFVYNMSDLAPLPLPPEELSAKLGAPVVCTVAARGRGIDELKRLMAGGGGGRHVRAVDVPLPALRAGIAAVLSRPLVAAPLLAAVGTLTLLALLALVEGTTPFGDFPYAIAPLLESASEAAVEHVKSAVASPLLASFLADGVLNAVFTVALLSVYIAAALALVVFYEETGLIGLLTRRLEGYLARAGVPPRGAICLLVGASCNVPAISTAAVLWGAGSRLLTALLVPYVPCVARLAIFVAAAAAALRGAPHLVPLAVFLPYAAALAVIPLASHLYRGLLKAPPLIHGEVPPAPLMPPSPRIFALKLAVYLGDSLRKVVPLLAAFILVLWPLTSLGPGGIVDSISESYLARAGRALEALFAPMGWTWDVAVSVIGGWVFKEVVLGLMEATGALETLAALPISSTLALLVFMAFYSACAATLASVRRIAGLKLALAASALQFAIAYAVALAVRLSAPAA